MNIPIIMAAFGTTSKAREVYQQVDNQLKERFCRHDIHWAFTSRIIRHHLKNHCVTTNAPVEVISKLAEQKYSWAVVQSFNMICGHEFYRLINDMTHDCCRVSIGHSLLCSQDDHKTVARALAPVFAKDDQEAVVLVGHGTDHCAWTVYPAFGQRLKEMYGGRAYVGMIEDGYPDRDRIIANIKTTGYKRVRLIPFMLVAGVHFREDLAGPEDSWKTACEANGLTVTLETEGLGSNNAIIDIFCQHIQSALDVIPESIST